MDLARSALDTVLAADTASAALEEEAALLEEQIMVEATISTGPTAVILIYPPTQGWQHRGGAGQICF